MRRRVLTTLCWLVAGAMVAWTIVRAFGLDSGYPVVPLMAFTPYVALLGLAAAALVLFMRRRLAALVIGLCAVTLVALVAPRAIPSGPPEPRPTGPNLTVMSANLLVGDADLQALADQVVEGDVDVLSLAELTPSAEATIRESAIGDQLPYGVTDSKPGSAGTGLFSRYPLHRLPAPGVAGNDLPTIIALALLPGGVSAEVYSIHPLPPNSAANVPGIATYLEAIPSASPGGDARLLVGDFNATLDNSSLRDLLDRGYVDAADATGDGLVPTWPQRHYPPPVTIDHVVVDERVEVLETEVEDLPGSDHRTVRAELRLPSSG